MAAAYSTTEELRAARTARSDRAREKQRQHHGITLLELQKSNEALTARVEDQAEYIAYILQCNINLAHEQKVQSAETRYIKQNFTALFWCSAIFSVLTLICVGTVLYFPAGIYPFALAALLLCLLYIGILALLMETM